MCSIEAKAKLSIKISRYVKILTLEQSKNKVSLQLILIFDVLKLPNYELIMNNICRKLSNRENPVSSSIV